MSEYIFSVNDCLSVFCEYMEVKAENLGLSNNTLFRDPCGVENESTPMDMLRCLIRGYECERLRGVWGAAEHVAHIEGPNAREQQLVSRVVADVDSSVLTDAYRVLGGKTGSLTRYGAFNISVIVEIPDSDDKLACTVMYADGKNGQPRNRFLVAKQALDAAMVKYRDRSADVSGAEVCAQSAVVCVVPPRCAADEYHGSLDILFQKNAGKQLRPASMTKMLTSVIVDEFVDDWDETITLTQEVVNAIPKGFYTEDILVGDRLTVHDAMYAMMLPSSNAAAYALANHVGHKILNDF